MAEIVASKPVNEATEKELRTRSTFPLDYSFYQTMRFGEYTPHYVLEGLDSDRLPLRSSHRLMSYTLQAPLLSDMKINKDYFFVPMQAILPLNWNKWYENPVIGQDCPNDAGPSVDAFWNKIGTLWASSNSGLASILNNSSTTSSQAVDCILKWLVFFERFYSDGSLMANLGIHGNQFWQCTLKSDSSDFSYDQFFDAFIGNVILHNVSYLTLKYGTTSKTVNVAVGSVYPNASHVYSLREAIELLRDDFTWTVDSVDSGATMANLLADWTNEYGKYNIWFLNTGSGMPSVPCDLRRMWAYQIVCWHYFSNDKVDYIYSAELFRQYIEYLVSRVPLSNVQSVSTFSINGLSYAYDALSAHSFDNVYSSFTSAGIFGFNLSNATPTPDSLQDCYAYFRALLGFNNSLRFKDYFTGSRTRPLAVGSVDVQVNSNLVNVVDVTRNIQRQRFFNAINRLPHQIEDYLEGLFGKRPAPDYHNPFFLARTTDSVFGQESEYTGNVTDAEQNNITSILRSNADKYCFEFNADRDCVVIGITSYDLPRAYGRSIERQALHLTRFDGFNPYMQFIGDQPVYRAELGSEGSSAMTEFGYQLRHMEYKQRYSQCAGGFRKFLPGYLFLADEYVRVDDYEQNPDYIRSRPSELDRFYKSLTGYSLGSYFHFIVKNTNSQDASRPMAFAPSIL